jgi:hypothetical protein
VVEEEEDGDGNQGDSDNEMDYADSDPSPRIRPLRRPNVYDGVKLPADFEYEDWSTEALHAALKHGYRTRYNQIAGHSARGILMPDVEFRVHLIKRIRDNNQEWLRRLGAGEETVTDEEGDDIDITDVEEHEPTTKNWQSKRKNIGDDISRARKRPRQAHIAPSEEDEQPERRALVRSRVQVFDGKQTVVQIIHTPPAKLGRLQAKQPTLWMAPAPQADESVMLW